MNIRYRGLIVAAALAAFPIVLGAQSSATDWPQFRGPNRDGVAASFSIPTAWPEQLTRVWKADVGTGYSTPVLIGNRVYVFSRQMTSEVMQALDAATETGWPAVSRCRR